MSKKIVSFLLMICILCCGISTLAEESAKTDVLYDMIEQGTWTGSNTSVCGIDSTRFPERGEVVYTAVKNGVGVNLNDYFEEPIKDGKVKISFDFYAEESYNGYPEFYLAIPTKNTGNVLSTSIITFNPKEDGTVKYYGGMTGTAANWTSSSTDATIAKGKWYTMESIIDFDNGGMIQGYLNAEKLYEVNGYKSILGLTFVVSGKETSNGKLYFDNITVTEIKNDLSVSFAYGEGDTAVFEFTQPITAEKAMDVKTVDILTGKKAQILDVTQISNTRIGYRMPSGLPYAEYQFVFGNKNVSSFGASITGSVTTIGSVGISEKYRTEVESEAELMADNFDDYTPMEHAQAEWTLDTSKWTKIGNPWWGMGPLVNEDKKLQIHTFYGVKGDEIGVKGHILDTPQTQGKMILSYDLSFNEYDPTEGNSVRVDIMSGSNSFPLIEVKGESIELYQAQSMDETPTVVEQITKINSATPLNYKIGLNFDAGTITITIDGVTLPTITMSDELKTVGISDVAFVGCRKVESGSEEECNGALIDNFSAGRSIKVYDYYPAVTSVRFIEKEGAQKHALDTISPLAEKVIVKFSEPVDKTELSKILITNSEGNVSYSGWWNEANNTWEMTIPERALKVKSEHKLLIPATICDEKGNTLVSDYAYAFLVGSNSRKTNIAYINQCIASNDKQGLTELLTDDPESIGIASVAFDAVNKESLAESIIDYAKTNTIEDTDESTLMLQKLVLLEGANNSNASTLWKDNLTYGISDIRVSTFMEERLTAFITEKISESTLTLDTLDDKLLEATVITVVNYADGENQVTAILHAFQSEIGAGDDLNLTDAKCQAVYETGNFQSLSALKSFIINYKEQQPEMGVSAGGGGGGGFVLRSTESAADTASDKGYEKEEIVAEKEEIAIFTDIKDYPWAHEAINALFAKGVIVGRGDNLFVPEADVLREETAKMIVEAFRFYIKGTIEFDDVKEEDWFYPYIVRAYNSGVVSGIGNGKFGSGQQISRQDLAVMIYNAIKAAGVSTTEEESEMLFVDHTEISEYALQAIYALREAGIISGDETGAFCPRNSATRAETAKMIYLATQLLK